MGDHSDRIVDLAQKGFLGEGKFLRIIDTNANVAPQFASDLKFFAVEFENGAELVPMVSKIQPKSSLHTGFEDMFFTEVTMYSQVLPFLGVSELEVVPNFIYGKSTRGKDTDDDIVIIEDLTGQGFVSANEKVFLDPNAVKLSLRKLGEFHGLSYRKKRSLLSEQLQSFGETLPHKTFPDNCNVVMMPSLERGFKAARAKNSTDLLDRTIEKLKKYGVDGIWKAMQMPKEPYAVIVHGDFNRNNMLFKYSNGVVTDVRFLDFQTSIYADPAIDLAFILYMNTSQETRNAHVDEFFQIYWEGLTSIEPNPGFSRKEFFDNFGTRALYGYIPCSFFLPRMLDTVELSVEKCLTLTEEELTAELLKAGGQEGDEALADIVLDLLQRGYLEKFVLDFEEK